MDLHCCWPSYWPPLSPTSMAEGTFVEGGQTAIVFDDEVCGQSRRPTRSAGLTARPATGYFHNSAAVKVKKHGVSESVKDFLPIRAHNSRWSTEQLLCRHLSERFVECHEPLEVQRHEDDIRLR